MKHVALALVAVVWVAAPARAQTPAPAPAPAPPTTAAPDTTTDKPSAKSVRQMCRNSAKSEGLEGAERQKAVSECFVKQRPDLAAKEQCRLDAKAKGIAKDDRKAFIKTCAKGKG